MELEASGDTCKYKKHVESHGELKKLYRETMETGEDSNKHCAEVHDCTKTSYGIIISFTHKCFIVFPCCLQ